MGLKETLSIQPDIESCGIRLLLRSTKFMNEANTITKTVLITELTKSPHGKLEEYLPICVKAVAQEPEFFAHLIAYNEIKGQIRDSKVALPIISLITPGYPIGFVSNSLAHLALLSPRDLLRALRFSKSLAFGDNPVTGGRGIKTLGRSRPLTRLVTRYLRARESNYARFERVAMQHRSSMKELYALYHVKPSSTVDSILFKNKYPHGSVFESIARLKDMSPAEAAGTILERRIPFTTALVALGKKSKEPDLVMALIARMSPTELVTNTKMLERLGITTNPVLRAAYAEAIAKASVTKTRSSRTATFKATVAATMTQDSAFEDSDPVREKLKALQEKQIETVKRQSGIDGDWLVLGDKSGSMSLAIETSRLVAATLAKLVTGSVELVFFDTSIRRIRATGKTYDQIMAETSLVQAGGGTSIGCGLQWALDSKLEFGGIVIVSDGCENTTPVFCQVYTEYAKRVGFNPVVYFYRLSGSENPAHAENFINICRRTGIDLQIFDLRGGTDHYALCNLSATMRLNRYSLIEEIMDTPLIDLDAILPVMEGSLGAR